MSGAVVIQWGNSYEWGSYDDVGELLGLEELADIGDGEGSGGANTEVVLGEDGTDWALMEKDFVGVHKRPSFKDKPLQWRSGVTPHVVMDDFKVESSDIMVERKPQGGFRVMDLDNGYFLVSFEQRADFNRLVFGGPCMIQENYLSVQVWHPNFDVCKPPSCAVVWIQIPGLPPEHYQKDILQCIGNEIGRFIRIDGNTQQAERGKLVRIAVSVDHSKPLLRKIEVEGLWFFIRYEDLPNVCFACGRVGNVTASCPHRPSVQAMTDMGGGASSSLAQPPVAPEVGPTIEQSLFGPGSTPVVSTADKGEGPSFGNWMIVRKGRHNPRPFQRKVLTDAVMGAVGTANSPCQPNSFELGAVGTELSKETGEVTAGNQECEQFIFNAPGNKVGHRAARQESTGPSSGFSMGLEPKKKVKRKNRSPSKPTVQGSKAGPKTSKLGSSKYVVEISIPRVFSQSRVEASKSMPLPRKPYLKEARKAKGDTDPSGTDAVLEKSSMVTKRKHQPASVGSSVPPVGLDGAPSKLSRRKSPARGEAEGAEPLAVDGANPFQRQEGLVDLGLSGGPSSSRDLEMGPSGALGYCGRTQDSGMVADNVIRTVGFKGRYKEDARGFSGGIWLLWRDDIVQVQVLASHPQFVHVRVSRAGRRLVIVTAVYGSPSDGLRAQLWQNLLRLCSSIVEPWVVLGDFNVLAFSHEKRRGGQPLASKCAHFRDWMGNCGLLDLGYKGPDYTWFRGDVAERLDRVLCNDAWRMRFPEGAVFHLPRRKSDHRLLLLQESSLLAPPNANWPFRFQAAWMTHPQFEEFFRGAWGQHAHLCESIISFTQAVWVWNTTVFGHIFQQKRRLLRRLAGLEHANSRGSHPGHRRLEAKLRLEYERILVREELLWMQKSRCQWLSCGDQNSHFFHTTTITRRKRNRIEALKDESGGLVI
ncbi:hypothetical protein Tsubulata_019918 [Turnera subulata]|uniref:CCHC-type domain-containing protein n=1 Tax=Turnera subulata TaxID=218843 RepID=A0A9Q0JRM8_9ROSI|nr:hypothetical protein Tsubulata_019918 [Turnera subulata]